MKLTQKRTQILGVLKKAPEPMSAQEIGRSLPDIDLVTIYRNLDLFVQEGMLKKLTFGEEAVYEFQATPHHHALCESCGKMIHFSVAEEKLHKLINIIDFNIQSVDITVKGTCVCNEA